MKLEGKRVKILTTIVTVEGALYEGEVVLVERRENDHWRCRDNMGRIFYVSESGLELVSKK